MSNVITTIPSSRRITPQTNIRKGDHWHLRLLSDIMMTTAPSRQSKSRAIIRKGDRWRLNTTIGNAIATATLSFRNTLRVHICKDVSLTAGPDDRYHHHV